MHLEFDCLLPCTFFVIFKSITNYCCLICFHLAHVKNATKDTMQWQIWLFITQKNTFRLSNLSIFHKLGYSISNSESDVKFRLGWCARLDIQGDVLISEAIWIVNLSHFKQVTDIFFVHKQVTDISTSLWDTILKEEQKMSICLGIFLPEKGY